MRRLHLKPSLLTDKIPINETKLDFTGRVTHICATEVGHYWFRYWLGAVWCQASTWTRNNLSLSIGSLASNLSKVWIHSRNRLFLLICNFDFVSFWLRIWCESLVWVIMGRRGVSQNAGVLVVLIISNVQSIPRIMHIVVAWLCFFCVCFLSARSTH